MGKKKYLTEEERKAAQREAKRRYYQNNKEKILEQKAEYRQNNKEKIAEYQAEYQTKYILTQKGRACNLLSTYKSSDKERNRGECTLTPEWIVKNIFNQPCHYCGKTDWKELGCDRIDNSLPHTPDNVVPCCADCNKKKARYSYEEFMRLIKKVG